MYMTFLRGYMGFGSRIILGGSTNCEDVTTNLVCKLRKTLYGQRQAYRQWHQKLVVTLVSLGFQHSKADYSLYSHVTYETITLVLIYVDNILVAGNHQVTITKLKGMMSKHFSMKNMASTNY